MLFQYLYLLIALIEIAADLINSETMHFFIKPLLMIVLVAFYISSLKGAWNKVHKLIVTAFAFSWVGDVALMFVGNEGSLMGIPRNPNFFLAGLGGFLVTHVLYAFAFTSVSDMKSPSLLKTKPAILLPLVIYMLVLLSLLVPAIGGNAHTKAFLVPVLVYSAAIGTMILCAVNRYKLVNDKSFAMVFGGALLFIFSDSIIAINKFVQPFGMAGLLIMVLYMAGQYFIAKGMLSQFNIYSKQ